MKAVGDPITGGLLVPLFTSTLRMPQDQWAFMKSVLRQC